MKSNQEKISEILNAVVRKRFPEYWRRTNELEAKREKMMKQQMKELAEFASKRAWEETFGKREK